MCIDKAEEAYRNQPIFTNFVDMVFHVLIEGYLSIYEVRDACTLGMNMYAARKPPDPIIITEEQAEQFKRGEFMIKEKE